MPLQGEYEPSTSDWARQHAEQIEQSGGTQGSEMNGHRAVLVTSKGAKTGKLRKNPLIRVERDGSYAAVASLGGSPNNPAWYHNLRADPRVELRDGTEVKDMIAREATGAEKAEWWTLAVDVFPQYAEYQQKTEREIPLFILDPA